MNFNLSDPAFLKIAGGAALYLLGGGRVGRVTKMGGLALAGWGAWQYATAPQNTTTPVIQQTSLTSAGTVTSGQIAPLPNYVHG